MNSITVIGVDPAFANFGLCKARVWDTVVVDHLKLISTEGRDRKEVRKSSDDLRRAKELLIPFNTFCMPAKIAFAEVPHGSQSARASWSLGIAVGVLAGCPIPLIQLSATEVKLATVGKKNASKAEMIEWAVGKHPEANWIRQRTRLTKANEHLADAVAVIYAGMLTDEFARIKAMGVVPTSRKRVIIRGIRDLETSCFTGNRSTSNR